MMQMVRGHRLFILLTLIFLTISVSTFSQSDSTITRFDKYPYIFIIDEDKEPNISEDEFYRVALKVVFPVDVFWLDSSQEPIRELIQDIIPRINTDSIQPYSMMVRGASSPEGPYRWNLTLGKERAAHTFNYINRHLEFPEEHSWHDARPEDYGQLLALMEEAKDPSYRLVKSLVDKYNKAGMTKQLKAHLMRIDGGRLWRRLHKKYYHKIRVARVVLFFKKKAPQAGSSQSGLTGYTPAEGVPIGTDLPATPDSIAIEILPEESLLPKIDIESFQGIALPDLIGVNISQEPSDADVPYIPVRLYRRHILGIRTNLLYDFFYLPGHYWAPSPNVQLEYYPRGGHITANLGFTGPYWHHWNRYQFWQIRDYVLEGRYYLKGQGQFIGPYASAYAHVNKYGIGLSKTKGWQGEGYGAGLLIGYTTHISRNHRWRLEFSLGAGYYQTRYDPYVYGNPKSTVEDGLYYYDYLGKKENFKKRNHVFTWFGPTNLGIHLTYDLLYRRIQKKGVSFNRSELFQREKGGAHDR